MTNEEMFHLMQLNDELDEQYDKVVHVMPLPIADHGMSRYVVVIASDTNEDRVEDTIEVRRVTFYHAVLRDMVTLSTTKGF